MTDLNLSEYVIGETLTEVYIKRNSRVKQAYGSARLKTLLIQKDN